MSEPGFIRRSMLRRVSDEFIEAASLYMSSFDKLFDDRSTFVRQFNPASKTPQNDSTDRWLSVFEDIFKFFKVEFPRKHEISSAPPESPNRLNRTSKDDNDVFDLKLFPRALQPFSSIILLRIFKLTIIAFVGDKNLSASKAAPLPSIMLKPRSRWANVGSFSSPSTSASI